MLPRLSDSALFFQYPHAVLVLDDGCDVRRLSSHKRNNLNKMIYRLPRFVNNNCHINGG